MNDDQTTNFDALNRQEKAAVAHAARQELSGQQGLDFMPLDETGVPSLDGYYDNEDIDGEQGRANLEARFRRIAEEIASIPDKVNSAVSHYAEHLAKKQKHASKGDGRGVG